MTASRLTTAELTYYANIAQMYPELGVTYKKWCPIGTLPEGKLYTQGYTLSRFRPPKGSQYGDDSVTVATARTAVTAKVIRYKYDFHIPAVEVAAARNNNVPLPDADVQVALKQMYKNICHLILEGSHTWDPVSISGMRDSGTDCGDATLDAATWDTATKPLVHAQQISGDLFTAGFEPPYNWILSSNLRPGAIALNNAAMEASEEMLAKSTAGIEGIHYETIGTSLEYGVVYPIAAASADDGVEFMVKSDPANFILLQESEPTVFLNPELDRDLNAYRGYVNWAGTFLIFQSTSIQYMPDVDLA